MNQGHADAERKPGTARRPGATRNKAATARRFSRKRPAGRVYARGPERFTATVVHEPFACVIAFAGELGQAETETARQALLEARREGGGEILVDVSALEFVDLHGLALLVDQKRRVIAAGGRLRLTGHRGQVAKLLRITGVVRALVIADAPELSPGGFPLRAIEAKPPFDGESSTLP